MNRLRKLSIFICFCLMLNCVPMNAQQISNEKATGQVVDAWISVTAMAFPEAAVALEAGKKLLDLLGVFDKPDAIGEALKKINERLNIIEKRIADVENKVKALRNDFFTEKNYTRLQLLRTKRELLQGLVVQLNRPTDDRQLKRDLAKAIESIANDFLDPELWNWSDMRADGQMLDPDFKPLPTLELYATTLATWMTAIASADGDNIDFLKRTYGPSLRKHIDYLTQVLPQNIRVRVSAGIRGIDKWPKNRICTYEIFVGDQIRHTVTDIGPGQVTMPSNNDMCQVPEAMGHVPQEDEIQRAYGMDLMDALAAKLGQLRNTGTLGNAYVGEFDKTAYQQDFLYAVKPDGELLWYRHVVTTKPKAAPPDMRRVTTQAPTSDMRKVGAAAGTSGSATGVGVLGRRANQQTTTNELGPGSVLGRTNSSGGVAERSKVDVVHLLEGPKGIGSGWGQFHDVMPAGNDSIYALTQDGTLKWYRLDYSWTDVGSPQWKGPINVGSGWQSFVRVVPAGDGILYAIDSSGTLRWYKHSGYLDGSVTWSGPIDIYPGQRSRLTNMRFGPNWASFKQVFSGGEGVMYSITSDGVLQWYHHRGYLTGTPEWDGPRNVGTGWQDFTRVFSTGDGNIYALKPTGEVLWYKHAGYKDGSMSWDGPVEVAADWRDFIFVFPKMTGTWTPPVIH